MKKFREYVSDEESIVEYTKSAGYKEVEQALKTLELYLAPTSRLAKSIAKEQGAGYLDDFKAMQKDLSNVITRWKELDYEMSNVNEGKIEKGLAYKVIVDRFDVIEDAIIEPDGLTVRVRGEKDSKFADVYSTYKNAEVAKEVLKKVKNFIGVK